MRFRVVAAALMFGSLASTTGCPIDPDLFLGVDTRYAPIYDGEYSGLGSGSVEFRQNGKLVQQIGDATESYARFYAGDILTDSGRLLVVGDVEEFSLGSITLTREVVDIFVADYFYAITYDVWADWDSVPMYGTEYMSFGQNVDDSLAMYDTLELTSLDEYDGGAWTIHVNTSGTLSPMGEFDDAPVGVPGGIPGGIPGDILDQKSGKTRR